MLDFVWNHWVLSLLGGSSVVGLIALAIFAPTVLTVIGNFLAPIATAAGQWVAAWMSDMAGGLADMFSNKAGIVFMITVAVGTWFGGEWHYRHTHPINNVTCEAVIRDLHQKYVFTPRKQAPPSTFKFYNPLTWL